MNTVKKKAPAIKRRNKNTAAPRRIKYIAKELSRDHLKLELPLLDAAVSGIILGFRPSDREMREQAERSWEMLKPLLSHHLLSEDETVLPWAASMNGFPPHMMERIHRSHSELRSLARALTTVSFEEDSDELVSQAGKALCMLAVKLDDMIDSEEMRMLPALRKLLFAHPETASEAGLSGC
jgi:hypothetical protein